MDEQLKTTLKTQRALANLTQAELAERAGITRKSVNAIEMGHMVPSILIALKLGRALGVSVETLFGIEEVGA